MFYSLSLQTMNNTFANNRAHKYSRIEPPRVAQLFNQWASCVSIASFTEKDKLQEIKKQNLLLIFGQANL